MTLKNAEKSQRESTQKSVSHLSEILESNRADSPARYLQQLDQHMLVEDVGLWLLPSHDSKLRLIIADNNKQTERIICEGFRSHYGHDSHDACNAISNFARVAAEEIIRVGTSYYEIVILKESNASTPSAFKLSYIPYHSVVKKRSKFYQHIPSAIAQKLKVSEMIELEPCKILCLKCPPEYSKERELFMNQPGLSFSPPEHFMRSLQGITPVRYDIEGNEYSRKIALLRATRHFGWNARDYSNPDVLEYYSVYRFLRFKKFITLLRDNIFKELNEALNKIGFLIGFKAHIDSSELISAKAVDEQLLLLKEGNVSCSQVVDFVIND